MLSALGANQNPADGEIIIGKLLDFDIAGQLGKRHREVSRFHLADERGEQIFTHALTAENAQPAALFVKRRKKRQALNMIPMCVRKEQRQAERTPSGFSEERLAEFAQSGAGVKDEAVISGPNFDAGGVTAVTRGFPSRRGNGAANAPKRDVRGDSDAGNLTHVW
jgi:hypothetical protein